MSATSTTAANPEAGPPTIIALPAEIHLLIFRSFHEDHNGGQLALGLTCSKFYNILKGEFPMPICLLPSRRIRSIYSSSILVTELICDNRDIVAEFLGPKYRPLKYLSYPQDRSSAIQYPQTLFLNTDTYGKVGEEADYDLIDAWEIYNKFQNIPNCFLRPFGVPRDVWRSHAYALLRRWEWANYRVGKIEKTPIEAHFGRDLSRLLQGIDSLHWLGIFLFYLRHYEPFWDDFAEWREMIEFLGEVLISCRKKMEDL